MTRAVLLCYFHVAGAWIPVPPATKSYGFDGPWNAVTAQLGGFVNGTTLSAQWKSVDLFPGGGWSTFGLSDSLCSSGADAGCGAGGTWDEGDQGTDISYRGTHDDDAIGLTMEGYIYLQNINVGGVTGGAQSVTTPNASLVAVDTAQYVLPRGVTTTDVEVGYLSLGNPSDQGQLFTIDANDAADPGIYSWLPNGYMYNTSVTKSYSYGLHIGSAAFNYPCSLIYGGYDQGRILGPIASFAQSTVQLLDIVIGVETGGTPFSFTSQTGLLLDNTSTPNSLPVRPDSALPYLHLPGQTCDKIASLLPVNLDASGYYLWDTSSSNYTAIINSASYLGFVFPSTGSGAADFTIKVPFALLNLTLQPIASGKSGDVPYFPCRSYTPQSGENYVLGRAFLQAAFLGSNWNQQVTWLAQAPGPGAARQGLGYSPQDIEDDDTRLDGVSADTSLFNQSWAGHWTPLADASSAQSSVNSTANATTTTTPAAEKGLSTGAEAGIGVGVGIAALLLIGLAVFFFLRRRNKTQKPSGDTAPVVAHTADAKYAPAPHNNQDQHEYNSSFGQSAYAPQKSYSDQYAGSHPYELSEARYDPVELPVGHNVQELAGGHV
nr:uncharacterized protein LOC112019704 [Quercus suber]